MLSQRLLLVAKIGLSIALIWYVASKFDFEAVIAQLRGARPAVAILILALYYVQLGFAALRFREFLALFGVPFDFLRSVNVTLVGYFFSQTFISFVGGDAMRLVRAVSAGVQTKIAAKALILDRGSGFVAQIALITLVLPFLLPRVPDPHMKASLILVVLGTCGACLSVLLLARLPGALRRFKALDIVADISSRVLHRTSSMRGLLAFLGYSIAISLMNVAIYYAIAQALSVPLAFVDCLILLPIVFFLSMLPISVSGWGVREGATVVALGLAGVPPASSLAISVSFGLGLVLISLPGGILWLFAKRRGDTQYAAPSQATVPEPNHGKD